MTKLYNKTGMTYKGNPFHVIIPKNITLAKEHVNIVVTGTHYMNILQSWKKAFKKMPVLG